MAILTRNRESGGDVGLTKHTIGNALVVYPVGNMTRAAQELALNVAADTENDLVVVDLPIGAPLTMWESVAEVLPKRRRGLRLVIGGRTRETTALAGHWLAERLKRTVLVPDGPVVRGAGGSLFVHSGQGSGWMRCTPGRPPKWEAKRFPCPVWDSGVVSENFPTSARGIAEPLPSGIWIRPMGDDPLLRSHRQRLIEIMPCQPEIVTVVLGSPGGVPLDQDDVVLMWRELPEHVRERVRFVQYGPMSVPRGNSLGQLLADALGREIVIYTGMPIGPAVAPEIFTVRRDGSLGWHAYARELSYRPRVGDEPGRVPSVVTHRAPIPGGHELSPGVYWYSVDAVVEVIQSGLLVRPPGAIENVEAIRSVRVDADTHNLLFEAATEADLDRMEYLAGDLSRRLDNSVRPMNRVVSAREVIHSAEKPVVPATAGGTTDTRLTAQLFEAVAQVTHSAPPALAAPVFRAVEAPQPQAATSPSAFSPEHAPAYTREQPGPMPPVPDFTPDIVPSLPLAISPNTTPDPEVVDPFTSDETAAAPPVLADHPFADPFHSGSVGIEPSLPDAGASAPGQHVTSYTAPVAPAYTEPVALVLEDPELVAPGGRRTGADLPEAAPIETSPVDHESVPTDVEPTIQQEERPTTGARFQPVPAPEASALLPKRGIEDERTWLRRTLSTEFGTMSNSVARVLSEHPGFQGALSRSSAEVLTDAVAVQLYLTNRGQAMDQALRTATVGPHVPFARCVVAGLSRLPSHRGPAVFSTTPTPDQWALYRAHPLLTEWGFLHALTAPTEPGDTSVDVLVWSMTARRTRLLEATDEGVQERVLFVPGTSFKVLEMNEPLADGTRGQILLRELTSVEIDANGRVDPNRISLDEMALNSLRRQVETWSATDPALRVAPAAAGRFGALPGLA